jgi:hypothetical protein
MSFIDWIGFWDGSGNIAQSPTGDSGAQLLAITSINTAVSSPGATMGDLSNYAVPSGSGIEAQPPNTDTQRNQDVLVRSGGNGR